MSPNAPLSLILADVLTNDPVCPRAEGVLVGAGRVLAVGSRDHLRRLAPHAEQHDYRAEVLTAGLADAHIHLVGYGFSLGELSLHGVRNVGEVQRRVAEQAARLPPGDWIRGGGFLLSELGLSDYPSSAALDEVSPHHPVFLYSRDLHLAWANSLALRLAGIHEGTPDPVGGKVVRPLGCLLENATDLVSGLIPAPSDVQVQEAAWRGVSDLAQRGYVSAHTMAFEDSAAPRALQHLAQTGQLPLRVWACLPHERLQLARELGLGGTGGGAMFQWGGVKFFADGALGSRTAWLHEPGFADGSGTGIALDSPQLIAELGREALNIGLVPVTHVIGDRAVHEVLGAYDALRPLAQSRGLRLRLEHVQHIARSDIARCSGLVISPQPIHLQADSSVIRQLLPQHLDTSYAFRSLGRAGAILAFGSDAPVAPPDVQASFAAATTRLGNDGLPLSPAEALSPEETLWAFTRGPAIAAGWDDEGWIVPGARAAFTVWDKLGGAARALVFYANCD